MTMNRYKKNLVDLIITDHTDDPAVENITLTIDRDFIYLSGIKCKISTSLVSLAISDSDALVIINYLEKIDNLVSKRKLSIYSCDTNVSLDVNIQDQVLIIRCATFSKRKFENIKHDDFYLNSTETLVSLFKKMTKQELRYNCAKAIGHITIVANSIGDTECPIKEHIFRNCADQNFNLDMLCNKMFMSRRKIQYLLKSQGDTFSRILKEARVNALKNMIKYGKKESLKNLARKSGFKNTTSANRDFKAITGVRIKEYIHILKQ